MNRLTSLVIIVYMGTFLAISGCAERSGEDIVLASIGGTNVTVSDFKERISNLPERYRFAIEKRKKEYLNELINDTLLYQEAIRKGLHKDKDAQKVIEEARKKILIARLLKDEVDDTISVTNEDIQEFYDNNHAQYMAPEVMRVSHILLPTREESEKILEELTQGAEFEDLARARSVDPTAQNGGDIGFFPKGQLMPEFENACARLEIGQISGVVKTKLGFHVIKLTDRKAPELKPIKQVVDDVRSQLRKMKRQKAFNGLLDGLREKTFIEINEDEL